MPRCCAVPFSFVIDLSSSFSRLPTDSEEGATARILLIAIPFKLFEKHSPEANDASASATSAMRAATAFMVLKRRGSKEEEEEEGLGERRACFLSCIFDGNVADVGRGKKK